MKNKQNTNDQPTNQPKEHNKTIISMSFETAAMLFVGFPRPIMSEQRKISISWQTTTNKQKTTTTIFTLCDIS